MTPPSAPGHDSDSQERFSLPLFILTVGLTLGALAAGLRWLAPELWSQQFAAPLWKGIVAFLGLSLAISFFEYFFHRYVLHTPAVPWLSYFYRQHTLHHALTRVARKTSRDGQGILYIENKFPIVEDHQHEAAFFPWYSMAVFAAVLSPLFVGLQLLWPSFPWFLAGFAALASSLSLYEILHAINHWPLERWEPLITHPRWGRFWQPIYGFHLRHHAVIDCNESISGFFGLPVADWVLGTCVVPKTVYADGEAWSEEKFRRPRPRAVIRWLDTWAESAVRRHRRRQGNPGSVESSSSDAG